MTAIVRPHPTAPSAEDLRALGIARFGMCLVLAGETMLFGGLIGAFLVFRFGSAHWPPPGMPKLPVAVTALNTILLFSSCVPMTRALRAIRRGNRAGLLQNSALAAVAGGVFLAVQGAEWVRLVGYGLTASSGPYGSTFYTLIGFHGLHVAFAVGWLVVIAVGAARGWFNARRHTAVDLATLYWYFVSGVWAVLFPLVYLGLADPPGR
jgi:cytochrome c oxidase subunit 3